MKKRYVFLLLLMTSMVTYMSTNFNKDVDVFLLHKEISELKKEKSISDENLNNAKLLITDMDKEIYILKTAVKIKEYDRFMNDVKRIPRKKIPMSLTNSYKESTWDYHAWHPGKYDRENTTPVAGVQKVWKEFLGDIDPNTIYAGYLVYEKLLTDNERNRFKALADYKGSITNFKPVYLVLNIVNKLEREKHERR